jgi:hypothetical protein
MHNEDDSRVNGCNITLETQPAQSPDINMLDLTVFRAIMSAQWDHGYATTHDGLIAQCVRAYDEYPPWKLENGFLTHACCLNEVLESYGNNHYRIPHMSKEKLRREGRLPLRIKVSEAAMVVARQVMPELDDD